jgi:F-type H+-transporting ATPase subunit gamma
METLEQLRHQLEAIDDLASIVRTMKALAAVNIRQYETAVHSLGHYFRTVELGLHVVLRELPAPRAPAHGAERVGAIVFGSDHGMCGRFNEEIAGHAAEWLADAAGAERPRIIAVGARVAALLEARGLRPEQDMFVPASAARIGATVRQVLLALDEWQVSGRTERVYLFHNRSSAEGRYRPTRTRLLPVNLHRLHSLEGERWPSRSLPSYTMRRELLFARLLRQFFFVTIFRACAESLAAENAARLAAMQSAERNLQERQQELLGEFRRLRQDAITAELLDVVSGYEALQATTP